MVLSAFVLKFDCKNAWRIFLRDRYNHKSPNSAQTEAACAGALHIRLGGDAYYFGELIHKPTLGDNDRSIAAEDICKANRLLFSTAMICLGLCVLTKAVIIWS